MKSRIISHRGNFSGANTAVHKENHPASIEYVMNYLQVDCEIDLHVDGRKFILGHDNPDYEVKENFLLQPNLWIHAKNFEALEWIVSRPEVNGFWHQEDDYTITTHKWIWTFPNATNKLHHRSVAVMPELTDNWKDLDRCYGICTDNIHEHLKT